MVVKIKSDLSFLTVFVEYFDNERIVKILLANAKPQELKIIFELARNTLVGNIPISSDQRNKLSKYEKDLIILAEKSDNKLLFRKKVKILERKRVLFENLIEIAEEFLLN